MLEPLLVRETSLPGHRIDPERLREYVDAILYVLRSGCPWRHLPHDFAVQWSAAHQQFMRWTRRGIWDRALVALREQTRLRIGRTASPTGTVVDSSSVKASPVTGARGFDGAKKVDGVKRHILTDTTGLLLAVEVTAANVQDRIMLEPLLAAARQTCPGIAKIWADKGYTGPATRDLAAKTGIDIEIVTGSKPPPGTGFLVQPRRWVVERTHAWINRNRRMVRQWEATLEAHTGFLILSQIAVLLNRLTRLVDRLLHGIGVRTMKTNWFVKLAATAVAGVAIAACGGQSQPEPSVPPMSSPVGSQVTVELAPASGKAGTSLTVTVPECEAGLEAGLAPLSRILLAPENPTTGDGIVLSGELARGTFTGATGTVTVPTSTAPGTYWVGVQCPINLGKATTGSYQLPDGRMADQGFGSAQFQVR